MRLHRLELSAFLAFGGHEDVDFDALADAGLFLLQGRTGAGKTSLLDAVCFALFGSVPGERSEGDLRSDHAAADVLTEVVLEVTLRGERLRIRRSPAQERPKLRGEGTTAVPHAVSVVVLDDDGSESVLATRPDEARAELEDRVGMTCSQFCQVALLPQGRFQEFLLAGSDAREALLRDLFDARRFEDVERWLADRARDARVEAGEAMDRVRHLVTRVAQEAGEDPGEGWEAAPEQSVSWLDEISVAAEARRVTAQAAAADAATALQVATTARLAGEALSLRQAEALRARAALREWEAGRDARDGAAVQAVAARRAAPGAALVGALAEREADAAAARAEADDALGNAQSALEAAGEEPPADVSDPLVADQPAPIAAQQAAPDADEALCANEPPTLFDLAAPAPDPVERPLTLVAAPADRSTPWRAAASRLRAAAGAAEASLPRERALEESARALASLQADTGTQAAAAQRLAAELTDLDAHRPALAEQLGDALGAVERLPGLEEAERVAGERAASGSDRDRLDAELRTADDEHRRTREAALTAGEQHLRLAQARLDGMAAELAGALADGEACAVCGSAEHPSPATAPEGGLATAEQVEAAAARAREQADARERAERRAADLRTQRAAAVATAGEEALETLRAALDRAREDVAAARRLAAGAERLAADLDTLDRTRETRGAEARGAEAQAASLRAQASEREAGLSHERAAVAQARGPAVSVAERAATLGAAAGAAERASSALRDDATSAAVLRRARAEVARAAATAGFADPAALAAAVRDDAAIEALTAQVAAWDERHAALRADAARDELEQAVAQDEPDLFGLRGRESEAVVGREGADATATLSADRHAALAALHEPLAEAVEAEGPARERRRLVNELADLASGRSVSNRKRMRLSAYVLAARLEQVAEAATLRLADMTGGRYTLEHADDTAKGNSRGGLGLRVVDGWTGRQRLPQSLSGGETFMASLALALGLSDVVTAEAGGRRLDTLFVDEGFGSLDDEGTLEQVLEVLDGLRDGGRVIGLVSHVAELRQRIPAQLRVEIGRRGSTVAPAALAAA